MIFTKSISPEHVVESLNSLHPKIWAILDAAVAKAREYFEANEKEFDVYLFSDLVRNEAREQLERLARVDIELIVDGFARKHLQNNGLEISYKDYRIKILKGRNGFLPAVGQSRSKRDFFYQQSLWELDFLNLVIIWNIDTAYRLTELRLACPAFPQEYPECSREHWSTLIPPSPTTIVVHESFDNAVDDLDIEPLRLGATGTDATGNDEDF